MIIRKLRLQRAWSQEQLAQHSGLNVRTIQRLERGQKASLESLKSLAAVFEVPLEALQQEMDMNSTMDKQTDAAIEERLQPMSNDERAAIEYVKEVKGFYSNLVTMAIILPLLYLLNLMTSPGYMWIWWVVLGWGGGLVLHAISVFEPFNLFGANWEKRQIEKRLKRRL
ncbi:2TM domain-containing protein [Shewanella insulae]|uniref:2TM domain-containing protein n=1 Tax=Shewanella insulae TaxID=2681496 RepID=UPI0023D8A9DA|nr:2TM domain-containing protein [Shewanella insulae]